MKKVLPLIFICILVLSSGVSSQERADVVESFTPSQAMLFMKTSRIKQLVESLGFVTGNLLSQDIAEKFIKIKDDVKSKTGVDLMDVESLGRAGIDTDRTVSLALYPSGRRNEKRIILFLPVKNEQTFPLKFIEILKKMSGGEKLDLYPVITEYRSHTIYQVQKDIFSTAFDGVFIMTSTGELIRSVIDVKESNSGYLSLDPMYAGYLGKTKQNYDLRAFATREFLKTVAQPGRKQRGAVKDEKRDDPSGKDRGAGKNAVNRAESEIFFRGPDLLNSVDYASVGVTVKPAGIDIDLSAQFNKTDERVNTFLDTVKAGSSEKALFLKDAAAYAYFSVDFNKIEELCSRQAAGCAYYAEFKKEIRDELGIDLGQDFIPYHSGVINIVASQPRGAGGGYVIYVPMNDPGRNKKIRDAIASHLKERYKNTTRFGSSTIGGLEFIWYIDSKNTKIYIAHDMRGLYMGNDPELMRAALSAGSIKEAPAGDEIIRKLGGSVFFLASIKKESFFGALIMLYAYRNKEISMVVDRMTDLYVIGEKIDNTISLSATIKLTKRK